MQLITIDEWWREHRPEAPELVQVEFGEALEQLRTAPGSGVLVQGAPLPDLRRLLLVHTRYHVYYVLDAGRATVEINGRLACDAWARPRAPIASPIGPDNGRRQAATPEDRV